MNTKLHCCHLGIVKNMQQNVKKPLKTVPIKNFPTMLLCGFTKNYFESNKIYLWLSCFLLFIQSYYFIDETYMF